jgi:hypothetical protein
VMAFRRSGRARVMARTSSVRSTRTCSLNRLSLMAVESGDGSQCTGYAPFNSTKAGA